MRGSRQTPLLTENVPVSIFQTSPCMPAPRETCARGAGIHGDVWNIDTEAFSACHTTPHRTHTTPHTHPKTQGTTHKRQHTTPTSHNHNNSRRQRKKRRRYKTRQDKTKQNEEGRGKREERRDEREDERQDTVRVDRLKALSWICGAVPFLIDGVKLSGYFR